MIYLSCPRYTFRFYFLCLFSARSRCAFSFLFCDLCITCTVHIARDSADKIGIITSTSIRFSCLAFAFLGWCITDLPFWCLLSTIQ
ncbi:hypothetical protein BDQ94DRAFT_152739 [Aspergillus welwitschiae]|uniref:Uncharacterized protein n=1 Tax=Aspergillus welwitschiae TaxID=1341132 RepID=A0A3F3PMM0_9EURO|nr:hypothetical protein BDQ94DRAFT_152739 [Aspergillus welwitschiae]RDH28195.1 hypothetical protein BDQ94DRAFT_152739 [Aspergillus welwitschiae]